MSASTPSSSAKKPTSSVIDWSNLEINDKKWLPVDVNIDSVSTVIRNLDLRHVNISNHPQLLDKIEHDKIIGFVCSSQEDIEFEDQTLFHKQWSFIPVRIENSALTIQILNLCAVNGKHRDVIYGYLLEKYLRDSSSSKENFALMNSVYAITPIAFAHNIAARDFPLPKKSKQQTYVFACLGSTIVLIGSDGLLYTFKQSNLPTKDFVDYLQNDLKCQVYSIVEDPFKKLCRQLEDKKSELASLSNEVEQEKTNCYLDQSYTYEDLKELSALSEQIEEAETFELKIDNGSSSSANKNTESEKPSSSNMQHNKTHQLEQQIREIMKNIEDLQKIFPQIYWPQISDSDLYGSKEYLKFYSTYKKVIHVNTPKLLKSYKFAPIRTPKTGESVKGRKRSGSTSSSIPESAAIPCATPKRRRSSRVFKEKQ